MSGSNDRSNAEGFAKSSITDVLHKICIAVDAYDSALFLPLWTVDARLDFGERYWGAPAGFIASLVESRSITTAMTHELEDISIELLNNRRTATSTCIVSADVTRLSDDGERRRLVRGRYEDRWLLTDGRWLIEHRTYRATGETLLPA